MSLILEALRKSETERRRAQAPDLFAEPAPATRHDRAASPPWLAWTLAAIAALLLTGWFARGLWNTPLPPAAAETSSERVRDVPSLQAPSAAGLAVADASASAHETIVSVPAPLTVAATATVAPPIPAAPLSTRPAESPSVAAGVRSADIASSLGSTDNAAPISAPMPPPAAVNASTPTTDAPLRLADLSSDERRQLPALKMSMHLWHTESSQRFVIVDGERMGEGDRIGDAVIDEITRDGVMLAWQGRRLELPIQ